MAQDKPESVNTCTLADCVPLKEGDNHWFAPHMPCWMCNSDKVEERHALVWHEESKSYFHSHCLLNREE